MPKQSILIKKYWLLRRFAKQRAISDLSTFFIYVHHVCNIVMYKPNCAGISLEARILSTEKIEYSVD